MQASTVKRGMTDKAPEQKPDDKGSEVKGKVARLGGAYQVAQLVGEPDRKGEESFDNVVLDKAGRGGHTSENELPNHGVVDFVEVELVVDDLVDWTAVDVVQRSGDVGFRPPVHKPGEGKGHHRNGHGYHGNPACVGKFYQGGNVEFSDHEELLENALAQKTAQECRHGKDHDGKRHGKVFVDMSRLDAFVTGRPVEGQEEEPEHVEGGKPAGQEGKAEHHVVVALECRQNDFILGEESGEGRNAGNGQDRNEAAPVGPGHFLAEAAHGVQVVGMDLMDEGARNQEQAALEEGVGKDVEGGGRPARCYHHLANLADAQGKHHVAQLRKGGVGENPLDVFLGAGDDRRKDHGEGTYHHNQLQGVVADGEEGEKPCHQIHARHHHGGAVDDGADRGRAFHGVR